MSDSSAEGTVRRRPLGQTGLLVSEIGFGAGVIGGGGNGTPDDQVSLAALARAFELGVNFVDAADSDGSGHCEALIGRALKSAPRRVHLAIKVGQVRRDSQTPRMDFSSEYLRQACDRSLSRLGVTCIDLYQLHQPPLEAIADPAVWDTLRDLKDKGKIAHYGISIEAPEAGLLAIEKGEVESIQIVYNLLERRAAKDLFPQAEKKGIGILVGEPLANGILSGKYRPGHPFAEHDLRRQKYPPETLAEALKRVERVRFLSENTGRTPAQAALCFALAHEAVSVVLPGIRTSRQVEENVEAGSARVPNLSTDELARVCAV